MNEMSDEVTKIAANGPEAEEISRMPPESDGKFDGLFRCLTIQVTAAAI